MLEDLQKNHPLNQQGNQSRILLWDNLSSHCAPLIHETVEARYGHVIIRRPPYRPADAPIEYVFCQLMAALQRRTFSLSNMPSLMLAIQNCVVNLKGFNALFEDLGY